MMKRYILICAAAALSVMPSAVAADYSPAPASQVEEDIAGKAGSKQPLMELSLDRCLEMALENNMDVLNSRLDVYAAKAQKQEAVAGYFPDVSVNAFTFYAFDPMLELGIKDIIGESEFSNTLQGLIDYAASTYGFDPVYSTLKKGISANVTVLQPVFAGGRIVNGNRLAALGLEAAGLQKNISERNTAEDVEKAYWQVVSLEEKMKTLDRMQALVDTLYKDVSSACAAGLATDTDMLQVRLRQNELRSGKISLKNGIRLARMQLFNDTGVRYNPYSTIANDSIPYIDDIILTDRPDCLDAPDMYWQPEEEVAARQDEARLLDISVRSKELEKKMVMGEALPQIGVGVSYGYSRLISDGRMNGAVFASLQIPLSDWGRTARKMQRYEAQIQKAENEKEYLNAQLVLQVRKLWIDLESAWEQLLVARESVAVAQAGVEDLTAYYDAGMSPLSELLDAQMQLQEAMNACVDHSISYRTALQAYLDRIEK